MLILMVMIIIIIIINIISITYIYIYIYNTYNLFYYTMLYAHVSARARADVPSGHLHKSSEQGAARLFGPAPPLSTFSGPP